MKISLTLLGAAGAVALGLALYATWPRGDGAGSEGISETNVALGREVYVEHCANCHGDNLEGQPDWKRRLPSGRLPAPPHDASGHTWHHPDSALFRLTKEGPAAVAGGGYESDMPAFAEVLSDDEIWAALAFIKSTWPERERDLQAKRSRVEREETK